MPCLILPAVLRDIFTTSFLPKILGKKRKINMGVLMRRKYGDLPGPGPRYVAKTSNLNRHPGGDWLYVVANEVEV